MKKTKYFLILIIIGFLVFILSLVFLIFGDELDQAFNVIGIRIATLFVAFVSFCSTSTFSYLIYTHNKTVSMINDDANKRAELFRELQFASGNYSIIDFYDRMYIYPESSRYIDKFVGKASFQFHMVEDKVDKNDVLKNPSNYKYVTLRIPYRVVEGKVVSKINFEKVKFERNGDAYRFISPEKQTSAFLLYNDQFKGNEAIINLIVNQDSDFYDFNKINGFSKIKINAKITSILGVEAEGVSELYFTNPEKKEEDGVNFYKINSSNFTLIDIPQIEKVYFEDN